MYEYIPCINSVHQHVCSAHGDQKMALAPQELELHVVSYSLGGDKETGKIGGFS